MVRDASPYLVLYREDQENDRALEEWQRYEMLSKPAWRYVDRDPILRELIKDGVAITVENYIGAIWRSELPQPITRENGAFLTDLTDYEARVVALRGSPRNSGESQWRLAQVACRPT